MADVFVCASSLHGHVTLMLELATHLHAAGHSAVRAVLSEDSYRERSRLVGEDIRRSDALGRITAEVEARSMDARP